MDGIHARFMAKVRVTDQCWLWMGAAVPKGYGRIQFRGRPQVASRVSYTLHVGEVPDGMCVLHSCDNPRCVNPGHLWLGTKADNQRDMASKGRHYLQRDPSRAAGDGNANAKLSWESVRQIRAHHKAGAKQVDLASRYGVRQCQISEIVRNVSWVE